MGSRGKLMVKLAQEQKKQDSSDSENEQDLEKELHYEQPKTYTVLTPVSLENNETQITENSPFVASSLTLDGEEFNVRSHVEDFELTDNEDRSYKPDSDIEDDEEESSDSAPGDSDQNREPQLDVNERTENANEEILVEKKLTRKRKKDPASWKRNVQKRLRMEGKQYCTQKGKLKRGRSLKDIECQCHYKCNQVFSKEQRQNILERFLKLDTQQLRWNFISKQVACIPKKRCYSANNDRRTYTYVYKLILNHVAHQVCQKFFLATLDISSKTVRTAISKLTESGTVDTDKRGRKSPPQKKSEGVKNIIRDHIKSIPKVSSHYCRSTTKRKYLPSGLSETRLYNDYKLYCAELGVVPEKPSYYKNIFTSEFNLGFHRPKKDQCDVCTKFADLDEEGKENEQEEHDLHLMRKQEARDHKKKDKELSRTNKEFVCFTMDMEKILITPSLNVGKLYYTQKLKTYNFTVYNLSNSEATNYMWHEGTGTKGSSEVATCLWKCLANLDAGVKEVTFYSDTASGQNRNSINAAMFLRAVTMLPIEVINQKYMEPGHSEMECDSVHSAIETRGNKIDVYTPESWYTVVRIAKTKEPFYKVVEMNYTDFLNFKDFSSSVIKNKNKNENGGNANWLKIKWLQYRKEDPSRIFYKERLSDSDFESMVIKKITTRKTSSSTQEILPLHPRPVLVEKRKLESLLKLCDSKCIPEAYHQFYRNLKSAEEVSLDSTDEEI